jgi:hypothetical protein
LESEKCFTTLKLSSRPAASWLPNKFCREKKKRAEQLAFLDPAFSFSFLPPDYSFRYK